MAPFSTAHTQARDGAIGAARRTGHEPPRHSTPRHLYAGRHDRLHDGGTAISDDGRVQRRDPRPGEGSPPSRLGGDRGAVFHRRRFKTVGDNDEPR